MIDDLLNLIYPRTCELCNGGLAKGEHWLCTRCISQLPMINIRIFEGEVIRHLIAAHKYSGFYAYLKYHKKGLTQKLLHKIKYKQRPVLAELMGQWLGHEMENLSSNPLFDLIIPVPLHPRKRKIRGYNQADFFAMGLSRVLNISWSTRDIIRTINNQTQTHKTRDERIENVKDVFQVINMDNIQNKRILLVDDVITTGATLESCAEKIFEADPKSVSLATIAVAK